MTATSFRVLVVPRQSEHVLTGPMTLAGLVLLACALTRLSGLDHAGFSFCYFKALTGRACLTCGTTRAFGHLSRLDLSSALAIQPLVTVGALGLMLWGVLDSLLFLASKRTVVRMEGRAPRLILMAGGALLAINWIYLLARGV